MNIKLENYIVCRATVEELKFMGPGHHNARSYFRMKTRPHIGEVIHIHSYEWLTVEGNKDTEFVQNIKDGITAERSDLKFRVHEIEHEVGSAHDLSLELRYIKE